MLQQKIQALSLAKECVINKLDLLTNATVDDDVMKYVQQSKEKIWSSSFAIISNTKGDADKGSNELGHDADDEKLEDKEEEEKTGETNTSTTNQVF